MGYGHGMVNQREEQKARSRRAITESALELASQRPLLDFSMQEVADEAGVSLRTVYNHFASREELLQAATEHVDDLFHEHAGLLVDDVDHVDEVKKGLVANFPVFERLAPLLGVRDRLDRPEGDPEAAAHDHRTRRIVELVREDLEELPAEVATLIGVLVRHTVSHRTWLALTADYGLTTDQASSAALWTLETILAAARRGDVGTLDEDRR